MEIDGQGVFSAGDEITLVFSCVTGVWNVLIEVEVVLCLE